MKFLRLYLLRGKSNTGFRWESTERYRSREHAQRALDMWRKEAAEGDEAKIMCETFRLHEGEVWKNRM